MEYAFSVLCIIHRTFFSLSRGDLTSSWFCRTCWSHLTVHNGLLSDVTLASPCRILPPYYRQSLSSVQISKVFSWCQVWPFSSVLFWPACLSLNSLQQSRVGALMYIFPIGVLQAWNCLQAESVAWQGSPHPLPLLLVCLFTETENTCFLHFIWLLTCLPRECLCFWIIFLHGWRKKF